MLLNQPSPTHTSSKGKLLFPLALFLALTLLGGLRFGDAQETADGRPQTAAREPATVSPVEEQSRNLQIAETSAPLSPFIRAQNDGESGLLSAQYAHVPVVQDDSQHTVEPPSDDEVVQALEKMRPIGDSVRNVKAIMKELIQERTDPPRMLPVIGLAQLHHVHYKCTVFFEEIINDGQNKVEGKEELYIDKDYFQRVDAKIQEVTPTKRSAVPGLSPLMGMSPATTVSTPSSPALDLDYIALCEKRVEVAKTEFHSMKEANEKFPHTFPEIDILKAELALAEAEYALKIAKEPGTEQSAVPGLSPWMGTANPYFVTRQIPEQVKRTLPSGEEVIEEHMKEVVEVIHSQPPIPAVPAQQTVTPLFDTGTWKRQPAPQEEMVFRAYPLTIEFYLAFDGTWTGLIVEDSKAKLFFMMENKSYIAKFDALLAQMKESQKSEEKAIAENKPILRRYKMPADIEVDVVPFMRKVVAKDVRMVMDKTGELVVWAVKSEQDKVSAILEQITQATEEAKAERERVMKEALVGFSYGVANHSVADILPEVQRRLADYPKSSVRIDVETNNLFIQVRQADQERVIELIRELDKAE